jgi:hypothetical protein
VFVVICKYYSVSYKKNPKNVVPPLGLINTVIEEEEERGATRNFCVTGRTSFTLLRMNQSFFKSVREDSEKRAVGGEIIDIV